MQARGVSALTLAVCLSAPLASAQDAPTTYVMGIYYRCTQGADERADAIFKDSVAPLLKKEAAAGNIGAYGWGSHWFGGDWRRLEYTTGRDLDKLVDSRNAVIQAFLRDQKKIADEFHAACPSHDDYIWASVASSQPAEAIAAQRASVANSTYFVCDSNDEDEADDIVKSVFAPLLNQHVKEGKIVSWNWMRHVMGGEYRRLLVFDGKDHKSVLKYWSTLGGALDTAHPRQADRFFSICPTHTDYVWDLARN